MTNKHSPKTYSAIAYGLVLLIVLPTVATAESAKPYSLLALYTLAENNDAIFRAEGNKYSALRLNPKLARSDLLPKIDLNFTNSRVAKRKVTGAHFGGANDASGSDEYSYDSDNWSLHLRQTLFDKKEITRLSQSKSETEQAAFAFASARQDLILRLAESYFNTLTAETHLSFVQAEKDAVAKQLQQAQTQFEVGLTPITDAKEAQAAYDLAVANEIDASNRLDNSYHRLEVITNRMVSKLMPLQDHMRTNLPEPNDMEYWVKKSTTDNFEVLSKKIAVNVARDEIAIQGANYYPSLSLFAEYGDSDSRRGSPAPSETKQTQVGVQMDMNLFSGGKDYYQTQQSVHRHREAIEVLAQTQREARRLAREAYLNITASISLIEALENALDSAQAAVASNQAGFNVGIRTSAEVLLVLKDLFETQRDYAAARHDYVLNVLRLKQAVGELTENDIQQINDWLVAADH